MAVDATLWMPSGMDSYTKQEHVDAHPDDPHAAAAAAWEDWAAQQEDPDPSTTVASLNTGVQSVTYAGPRSVRAQALERAAWHRARTAVTSVTVGPSFAVADEADYRIDDDTTLDSDDPNNEAVWRWSP